MHSFGPREHELLVQIKDFELELVSLCLTICGAAFVCSAAGVRTAERKSRTVRFTGQRSRPDKTVGSAERTCCVRQRLLRLLLQDGHLLVRQLNHLPRSAAHQHTRTGWRAGTDGTQARDQRAARHACHHATRRARR